MLRKIVIDKYFNIKILFKFISILFIGLTATCPLDSKELNTDEIKIALVLGAGGAKGIAHLGVLKELSEAGVKIDLIVGCSSGAIIGAMYADCLDIDRITEEILSLDIDEIMDYTFTSLKKVSNWKKVEKLLKKQFRGECFEDLNIPTIVVATNLENGEIVEINSGELIPALKASAALPGIFSPVKHLGMYLVDGGVTSPVPVKTASKYSPKHIIAVDVSGYIEADGHEVSSFPDNIFQTIDITVKHLSECELEEADVVIRVDFDGEKVSTFAVDGSNNQALYECGRRAAKTVLEEIKALITD